MAIPERIENVEQLEELLSRPTPGVVSTLKRLDGDVIILGVGGKIGPSLARMIRRADEQAGRGRRVIGAARFSKPDLQQRLEADSVETIRCDLLDRESLFSLPEMPNVLYLAGMKFGSTGREGATWAGNTYLPGMVCEKFRQSRIVAYSTGNVYPLTPVASGGSVESDPPAPIGEYAMSCLGRERMFGYFSEKFDVPVSIIRLNYANEMRYGAIVDIAVKILAGEPIDVTMGYFNAVWQGDNNAMTLQAFDHAASPPKPINVTGRQTLSVREVAGRLGELMDRPVKIVGREAPDALLSNASLAYSLFGPPLVDESRLIKWIADWTLRGGPKLDKPTHFEVRNGRF
ncbi:MAG: NAD-dependent epimerase/dehydratase family protein [Pirellulales bacterium]|nr:NAD-dependent epimerase/dehydratase family protein [Pirellulales bacterium]